jgi:TetR/AcrR family tetracycline transcriptional repressor
MSTDDAVLGGSTVTNDQRRARLEDLPWTTNASGGTRDALTREQIVEAAIRLVDAHGLGALSMRRLGQELGAGATSLYWHIKNKHQLEDLMLDALIGEVATEIQPADDWRGSLAEVARALRRVLIRHRDIAPLLGERPTMGPHALDAADRVMGILRGAGFDDRTTSLASGALINYASGFALFESRSPGGAAATPEDKATADAVMAYFRALPAERYPNLLAVARVAIDEDEQFEYGLQRLLDGFEADQVRGGVEPGHAASGADASAPAVPDEGAAPTDRPAGPNAMLLR